MRILFIVASYQKNKDGVADYTFLLAKECMRLGHEVAILAWNDIYVQNISREVEDEMPQLRLPSSFNSAKKKAFAADFVSNFWPDVVSIQMVCFGFDPRGWIFGLGKLIRAVVPNHTKVHIMFHELWLGLATNHPLKEKLYGFIQKLAILQLWKELNPSLVHVGNNVYFSKLKQIGLPVYYLPLLSNITIQPNPDFVWISKELEISNNRQSKMVMIFFGSIHDGWNIDAFLDKMLKISAEKQLYVVSVGSQGKGKVLWEQMAAVNSDIRFVKLGFRSDSEISELLQFADFGICTTPLSLFGKSGTAMAMVEHGLPIIVTRDELEFDFEIHKIEEYYPNVWMWEQLPSLNSIRKATFLNNRITRIVANFLKDVSLLK